MDHRAWLAGSCIRTGLAWVVIPDEQIDIDALQCLAYKLLADGVRGLFTNFALGGAGAISASAQIRPDIYVQLLQQMESGDVISARATLYQTAALDTNGVQRTQPSMQGLIKSELPPPMLRCISTSIARLECLLAGLVGSPALQAT